MQTMQQLTEGLLTGINANLNPQTVADTSHSPARQTEEKQQLCEQPKHLALRNDGEGKKAVSVELYERFQATKTYGKDQESLEDIIKVFMRDLGDYPTRSVMAAIKNHCRNSPEFPTVADIIGIIRRRGKMPYLKEAYISKQRIDPEDRTPQDWAYIKGYESQQNAEEYSSDYLDYHSQIEHVSENEKLRKRILELQAENARAWAKVRELELLTRKPAEPVQVVDNVTKTIAYLESIGASTDEINDFIKTSGTQNNDQTA